ncbi:hypothetical protein OAU50_03990 [Planctomycetota bacterium]|nr:hypothetical protein [Planctomycetota bacterium]
MKFLLPLLLLTLTACTTGSTSSGDSESFASSDTDQRSARNGNTADAARVAPLLPLTAKEEAEAALLVSNLQTEDSADKNDAISKLVALGPRYLEYFRNIKRDDIGLDLMYVVSRIETEHNIAAEQETPAEGPVLNQTGNGGESSMGMPDYTDVDDFDRGAVEQFLASRLGQAQTMLAAGRPDMAMKIARAALTLLPDTNLRPDFDALILQAKNESQADLLIAGSLDLSPAHLQYESMEQSANFLENLKIRCFLKNVSASDITLQLYDGENKESVLILTVQYEQHDYAGNVLAQVGNVRLPVREGNSITLKPNQSYELVVPLESLASLDKDASRKAALGVVSIEAALRVYGARDSEDKPIILRPVTFPSRTVHVFPHSFDLEENRKNAASKMSDYIKKGDAQAVFMCAHLLETDEYRAAGDLLVSASFDDSPVSIRRSRLKCMHKLFKVGKNWDIEKWREWWQQNRRRN